MSTGDALTYFVAGLGIGSVVSMAGAVFSYFRYMASGDLGKTGGPMGTLLVMNGTLVAVGVLAILIGALTGQLAAAMLTGFGVFVGFSIVFGVMLYLWLSIQDE